MTDRINCTAYLRSIGGHTDVHPPSGFKSDLIMIRNIRECVAVADKDEIKIPGINVRIYVLC